MEQYEFIRRDARDEGLSIRALAKKYKVHRRTVRQALADPTPPVRKTPVRVVPVLGPYTALVRGWLVADKEVPRKQRHTARRVWQRLVEEEHAEGSESSVQALVAQLRYEIDVKQGEVCVPQTHPPAEEAEVDFGEFTARIGGVMIRPLPEAGSFDVAAQLSCRVDGKSRICVRQSYYSVPARYAGRRLQVRLGAYTITALVEGKVVAEHVRSVHKYTEDTGSHTQHGRPCPGATVAARTSTTSSSWITTWRPWAANLAPCPGPPRWSRPRPRAPSPCLASASVSHLPVLIRQHS